MSGRGAARPFSRGRHEAQLKRRCGRTAVTVGRAASCDDGRDGDQDSETGEGLGTHVFSVGPTYWVPNEDHHRVVLSARSARWTAVRRRSAACERFAACCEETLGGHRATRAQVVRRDGQHQPMLNGAYRDANRHPGQANRNDPCAHTNSTGTIGTSLLEVPGCPETAPITPVTTAPSSTPPTDRELR